MSVARQIERHAHRWPLQRCQQTVRPNRGCRTWCHTEVVADAHHRAAVEVSELIAEEEVLIAAVTLAECLVAPAHLGRVDDAELALRAAFEIETADDNAARRAASRLRLPGAIVLETALHHHARAVATSMPAW